MFPQESNAICQKLLETMLSKQQVEDIDDDRYAHVVSRAHSRFAAPITPNQVLNLEFHPSGHYMAYTRADGSLTVWKLTGSSFARSKKMSLPDAMANSVSWDPKETSQLATCGFSHDLTIWSMDDKKREISKLRTLALGSKSKVEKCMYDPSGHWLLAVTDGALHIFDITKDYQLQCVLEIESGATVVSWTNSGSHVVLGFESGNLSVLQIEGAATSNPLIKLKAHRSAINSCCVDPWGRMLITGSDDGTCAIWELNTMCCVVLLDQLCSPVCSLDVDPTGKMLAVCTEDKNVQFCDTNSGQILATHNITNFSSKPIVKFYPDKSWFILSSKHDSLERHFTSNQYNDPISLWKAENEKVSAHKPNSRKVPKRDGKERGRVSKWDSHKGSRYGDKFP